MLKEWQDLVLEHGAYGSTGHELEGKLFFSAVTCGGRRGVYCETGANRYELRELFAPFEQTFLLCRMRYLPPFALFAAGHRRRGSTGGACRRLRSPARRRRSPASIWTVPNRR